MKFLWNSKNEHGVHSPFVFALVTQCFYDRERKPEYTILKEYRKTLLRNNNTIEVTDFGAGSKVFKSNTRAISRIAANAGISKTKAELLFRVVRYCKPVHILEIGTSLGLATAALSLGSRSVGTNAEIISLEGCPETATIAEQLFQQFQFKNVRLKVTEFNKYLTRQPLANRKLQLIYFDGNHSKQATLQYFELLLPTVTNDSIWIFDDIHWSTDMEEAWEIIKKHPKVTITIDIFQWGMVFFRNEQEKEHFKIRA